MASPMDHHRSPTDHHSPNPSRAGMPRHPEHRRTHAHLLLLGTHLGVYLAYNGVLAALRELSPLRYLFWGVGLVLHALAVRWLTRDQGSSRQAI